MSNKSSPEATGTFVFSDETMEDMENLESTEVMKVLEEFANDHDATEVLDEDLVGDLTKS